MDDIGYLVGFYFELSFAGDDAAFQEASGISKEVGIEEVVCGGENMFKYRLPTVTASQNLVLRRAIIPSDSQLITWCSRCIDGGLALGIKTQDVTLRLLDPQGRPSKSWKFHSAYPVKYSVSDLKSQDDSLVIESIELAYTYFDIGGSAS